MSWYTHGVVRQQWMLLLLIGMMAVVYAVQLFADPFATLAFMARPAEIVDAWRAVREGEATGADYRSFTTLLTCAFMHANGGHLVQNMVFLWLFAALAVELLGGRWLWIIFFVSALTGSICHVVFNAGDATPMLGASGAVMGFEGAYLGMAVRWKLPDPHIFPLSRPVPPAHLAALAVIGVAIDWTSIMSHSEMNVAYGAHLGGFIGGVFLTSFVAPKPKVAQVR